MNQYKIWYLSSEVSPFAKTGGLGDVTGALPKSLKARNQEIRVIMPKYKMINERKYILREVIRLKDIPVTVNGETKTVNVKSAFLPDSKVQIYFVDIPDLFGRNGLYTDNNTEQDFPDNAQRFAFFCRGALETLKILSWKPDIIHCNDWQTAFVPVYLNTIYKNDDFFKGIKTVFTIHNFSFQGVFDKNSASLLDFDETLTRTDGPLESNGKLNLMKGALHFADWINTVSETYAAEISSDNKFGYGLEKEVQKKKKRFSGIVNGVDYSVWAPEVDRFIPFKYSADDLSGKTQNKQAVLSRVGLKSDTQLPLIGMIARITEQKGFSLLIDSLDELLEEDVQFIILGKGDPELENKLLQFQKKHPGKISLNTAFDETLAHMVEAGADMFLMPSSYEPCGMNQMYSQRYGTLPIVFKTGGLADTVQDIDANQQTGNGIVFERYTAKELTKAVKKALNLYKKQDSWQTILNRIMSENHSWEVSTEKYLEVYTTLLNE